MKSYMKQGWRLAVKHMYVIILLFLYQLIAGFFLYRYIDSVVSPLLRRWPADSPSDAAVQLFLSEAQFRLLKTDLATPYLWLLAVLLALRMLLTPVFNAGLVHSLHHARDDGGTKFFQGIRLAWKKTFALYGIQALLTLAPAWWLLPLALESVLKSGSAGELLSRLLPPAAAWLLWGLLLQLLSLAMQFGAVSGKGTLRALGGALRHLLPYAGVSLAMWGIGAGLGLLVSGISLVWAGLLALILHQGYYFVRTLLKVWTMASQYKCLEEKQAI